VVVVAVTKVVIGKVKVDKGVVMIEEVEVEVVTEEAEGAVVAEVTSVQDPLYLTLHQDLK